MKSWWIMRSPPLRGWDEDMLGTSQRTRIRSRIEVSRFFARMLKRRQKLQAALTALLLEL